MPTIIYLLAIAFAIIFLFVIFAAVSFKPVEEKEILCDFSDCEYTDEIKIVPSRQTREPKITENIPV